MAERPVKDKAERGPREVASNEGGAKVTRPDAVRQEEARKARAKAARKRKRAARDDQ